MRFRSKAVLQRIERLAQISVARGCGFAALGIVTFMVGLSGDMVSSLKAGGLLSLFVCLALLFKAWLFGQRSYKSTEVWLMLTPQERPAAAIAQPMIADALRDTCLRFALHAARVSTGLLAAAVLYALIVVGQP
jgi:hypothetical protein